jgi:hypothetical protein
VSVVCACAATAVASKAATNRDFFMSAPDYSGDGLQVHWLVANQESRGRVSARPAAV